MCLTNLLAIDLKTLMKQIHEIVENILPHVKIITKLTNLTI